VAGVGDGRVGEVGAADGAGDVRGQPRVDARGVEHVAAPGEEAELLAGVVERGEADGALERAAPGLHRPRRRVREHRQRLHRGGVQPRPRGAPPPAGGRERGGGRRRDGGVGGEGGSAAARRVRVGSGAAAEEGREEAEHEERDDQTDEEERGGEGKPTPSSSSSASAAASVHEWWRRW